MASEQALENALGQAVAAYLNDENHPAHRCYIGLRKKNGRYTDEVCVVVAVPEKKPMSALAATERIPAFTYSNGERVAFDIQEEPEAAISILRSDIPLAQYLDAQPMAGLAQRQCQEVLVGGGAQIQPKGAGWVGTLGGMVVSGGEVACLTNAHVTGLNRQANWPMMQPSSTNSNYFALVRKVVPIDLRTNAQNTVDLAILDPRDKDGKHRCKPEQIGLGRLGTKMVDAKLGMRVVKSGRTTGVTKGRCVGVKGVSLVGYDAGKTARFVDQDIFASDDGKFSDAGDSGSFILEEGTNNLVALLFAGGGNDTIGNPSRHVAEAANATLYGA